jgi:atypical dual specificity phosphatase
MFIFKKKIEWEDEFVAKAGQIYSKLTSNPLFWASAALFCVTLFCSYILLGSSSPVFLLGAAIVGFNACRITICHWKEIFYESSLLFITLRNLFKPQKFPWWNQIDDQILLGAIPLKERKHHKKIPAQAILTLLEEFELANRWPFTTAVSFNDWQGEGVINLRIHAVDIEGVKIEEIKKGIKFIREQVISGRTVYVHCKAGIGRSATVVACYLLKYGLANGRKFHSPEEVSAYLFEKRDQVRLQHPHRKLAIENYFSSFE